MDEEAKGKEAAEKAARENRLLTEAVLFVMNDRRGRHLVSRLLDWGMIDRNAFTGSSQTYFNLGRQYVAQELKDELRRTCPELLALLEKEGRAAGYQL